MIKIDKITLNNFRFFIDENEHNSFELNGKNMLVYGENGSGKSSLYKAFELLAKPTISDEEFKKSVNIFKQDNSYLEFEFDNNETLRIDNDHLKFDSKFIKNFSLTNPLLDYKKLLYINFSTNPDYKRINIYPVLEKLFENYPMDLDAKRVLKDIVNPNEKLEKIKEIVDIIKDDINLFLTQFTNEFYIDKFIYTTDYIPITKSLGLNNILEFVVNIDISFQDNRITEYQNFLNEARLSALAISIYFAVIKHLSRVATEKSLKILVLDDLLISLDMNNRLNLIDILKREFSDFQIFFFTHDKGFFEILKDKMSWKSYEIYVDSEGKFEKPYIKKSLNYFESAVKHFDNYDYPACANYLRKEVERLKSIKEKQEKSLYNENEIFKKIKKTLFQFDLTDESKSGEIKGKLIGFKKGLERDSSVEIDLKNIRSITDRILNPQSHYDNSKPLYKKELQEAIEIIAEIRENIS